MPELLGQMPFLHISFINRLYVHIVWHPVIIDAYNMWHIYRSTFFSALASMWNFEQPNWKCCSAIKLIPYISIMPCANSRPTYAQIVLCIEYSHTQHCERPRLQNSQHWGVLTTTEDISIIEVSNAANGW